MGQKWRVPQGDTFARDQLIEFIRENYAKRVLSFEIVDETRTGKQNNALHVWCEQQGIALNDAGFDQRKVFELMRAGVEIPWNKTTVKENQWRPIQQALMQKDSTTELTTVEPDQVLRVLQRFYGEHSMPCVAWPTRFGDGN